MKKRTNLLLGVTIIILGLINLANIFLPDNVMRYIFNYQVLLITVGIYLLIKKGIDNILGIFMIAIGIYLYIDEYIVSKYFSVILPIILIIFGSAIIYKEILENKNQKNNKDNDNKGE